MNPVDDVRSDLEAARNESDYAAVNTLWLALLKLANENDGKSDEARMKSLVRRFPTACCRSIAESSAVDSLLSLEPPLESMVSQRHEELRSEMVAAALEKIRRLRTTDPSEATLQLVYVLKIIRNKREHGFKSRSGPRDAVILSASRQLLSQFCRAAWPFNEIA